MSTFAGKFKELPFVSADLFNEDNFDSEVYFLSHCHSDHMVGLKYTSEFVEHLKKTKRFLYVSPISKTILEQSIPKVAPFLKELDLYSSTAIVTRNVRLSVTTIPAGHCPGSVMFLFEGLESKKNILYTGDFRLKIEDLSRIKNFYNSHGVLKPIYKIYLDTTFFSKNYRDFPPRKESIEQICTLSREWISQGPEYIVYLDISAKYGYENLFMEIYKNLQVPIHVSQETYNFQRMIPEMDKSVTINEDMTQLHSGCGCFSLSTSKKRTIKISAMYWTNETLGCSGENMHRLSKTYYRVCYATHASYNEALDLIKFLKPSKVEPNVFKGASPQDERNKELLELIDDALSKINNVRKPKVPKPKLFRIS